MIHGIAGVDGHCDDFAGFICHRVAGTECNRDFGRGVGGGRFVVAVAARQRGAVRFRRIHRRVPFIFGHAVAGGDPDVGSDRNVGECLRVHARAGVNVICLARARVQGVVCDRAAAVKPVQPRNRDC